MTLFCRHLKWEPVNAIWSELPDGSLSMSWSAMQCLRCNKVRWSNVLKPRESIVLTVEGVEGESQPY